MRSTYMIKEVKKLQNFLVKVVVDNNKGLKEWKERKNKMSYFQFFKKYYMFFSIKNNNLSYDIFDLVSVADRTNFKKFKALNRYLLIENGIEILKSKNFENEFIKYFIEVFEKCKNFKYQIH